MTLPFSFLAGILAFASPCIIPMITIYLGLITGMTVEELAASPQLGGIKRKIVGNTLLFIAGYTVIFALAGTAAGLVGRILRDFQTPLNWVGGAFMMVFGLQLAGVIKLPLPHLKFLSRWRTETAGLGRPGAFLVGTFFAVACSHCIGPLLYAVLIFAGLKGSPAIGALSLTVFSLGLAVPYLMTAVAVRSAIDHLARLKERLHYVSWASGAILVVFGALIFAGKFSAIADAFSRVLPYKFPGL